VHISKVQQGRIVEQEFAKLVMMGSKGRIELAPPLTDDERRDFEIHVRGQFGFGLAIQVKSTMHLQLNHNVIPRLHCAFWVPARRIITSPLFYYFLAHLDPKLMRLTDPAFLIPSSVFHQHAGPVRHGSKTQFNFMASMLATSHDRWRPFQVNTLELGEKMLEIMSDLRRHRDVADQSAALLSIPGSLHIKLADAGINVRFAYLATNTRVVIGTDDVTKARQAIGPTLN